MPSRPCANLTRVVGLAGLSQQPKGPDCRSFVIGVRQAGRQVYVIGEIFQRFLNNGVRNTKGLASWLISPQVEGSPRRFLRLKIRITPGNSPYSSRREFLNLLDVLIVHPHGQ